MTFHELFRSANEKIAEAKKVTELAEKENRDCTEEEATKVKALLAEARELQKRGERARELATAISDVDTATAQLARQNQENQPRNGILIPMVPAEAVDHEEQRRHGFQNFGQYAQAIHRAGNVGGANHGVDNRLTHFAAVTGLSQGSGPDAGFAVPPAFSLKIWDGLNQGVDSLFQLCDVYTIEGESTTFLANAETSRVTGSRYGGARAYWLNEGDQLQGGKPKLRQVTLKPEQIAAICYITDKLITNSPIALEQWLSRSAIEEINFLVGDSILNGNGVGKPLGLTKSGALISVAKETSQAVTTLQQENVSKMWARLHPRSRGSAIWLHNVDVEPALDTLSTVVKNVAGTENVGGYANKVFDPERRTLKGRPLFACEYCETLGTKGDIVLVDLTSYAVGIRGNIQSAMSMHLRFDYAETAFRFIFEIDGKPWLVAPLTPFKGSNTLSTFVSVDNR